MCKLGNVLMCKLFFRGQLIRGVVLCTKGVSCYALKGSFALRAQGEMFNVLISQCANVPIN